MVIRVGSSPIATVCLAPPHWVGPMDAASAIFRKRVYRQRLMAPYWKDAVSRHEQASLRHSLLDVATSVFPYLALSIAMYLCLEVSVWITLVLAVPAAGFLLRTFIVFHDCAHGSFLPGRRGNLWLGRFAGLLVF